jgi:hypothetical protein
MRWCRWRSSTTRAAARTKKLKRLRGAGVEHTSTTTDTEGDETQLGLVLSTDTEGDAGGR